MACEEQNDSARKLKKGQGKGRLCTCEPEPRTMVDPNMVGGNMSSYEMPRDQFAIPLLGRVSIHWRVSRKK
jgi:hypothetical protein